MDFIKVAWKGMYWTQLIQGTNQKWYSRFHKRWGIYWPTIWLSQKRFFCK
jgi:hypothetical protein